MGLKNYFNQLFEYHEPDEYEFILPKNANDLPEETQEPKQTIYPSLSVNLEYFKTKYNLLINSDVKFRKFTIPIQNQKVPAMLLYIDGMVDEATITNSVLQPLLLKNSITMQEQEPKQPKAGRISITRGKQPKINLETFIFDGLIPHNSITKQTEFEPVIKAVNGGSCALFVDTVATAFCVETKGVEGRSVSTPMTENIVRGSQEAFVESLRTNTSLLRKIVNNENLVIEEVEVGVVSKTKVAICYVQNIANDDLVAETKYRINNLNIDSLTSSGQLEQFIKDNPSSPFPQTIATERPDRVSNYLLDGRIAIVVNRHTVCFGCSSHFS